MNAALRGKPPVALAACRCDSILPRILFLETHRQDAGATTQIIFMRPLSDREKRTVRFAGIGIAIYLALFGGFQSWKFFEKKRADYRQLAQEAQTLRQHVKLYRDKVLVVKKMMDDFHFDPATLNKETVVSDASAAIQRAAKAGGLQLGPIRETPTRGAGKSLATVQLESTGQVPAVLTFLASLNRIGFPVVVDSVQFTADRNRPDQLKINLTLIILDFDQQKSGPPKTSARRNRRRADFQVQGVASFQTCAARTCAAAAALEIGDTAGLATGTTTEAAHA